MHILIVRNNSNPQAQDASLLLATYLATQSITYTLVDSVDLSCRSGRDCVREALAHGIDMAVALGGDGTILRTARQVGTTGVPVLGINFGRLGFLANTSDDGVVSVVAAALAGDVVAERRTNLRIDVACEGEAEPSHSFFALNEVAVTRGALGRIIDFSLGVSGSRIADMRGDGLVVATATGSTGYALSAGGPLVAPGFTGLVVVPLAAHTLHSRAIVTASNDVVEMDLSNNAADREATLFIDGEMIAFDRAISHVCVRRGDEPTILLRYQREDFYEHAAKVFF